MRSSLNLELAFEDLVAALSTRSQPRHPYTRAGEFALLADFNGAAIRTSIGRSKRLVHFESASVSIWRHAFLGPQLARISTWTKCNSWIKFAERAPLYAYYDVCEPCARALRAEGKSPSPVVDF